MNCSRDKGTVSAASLLVATPQPDPRETAIGYLLRLTEANGYASPSDTLRGARNENHSVASDRGGSSSALMDLAALDSTEAERLQISGTRHSYVLLGHHVRSSDVNIYYHKICPICIADDGIFDASWHLRLVSYCPVHRVRLVDRCEACGMGLRMNRQGPGRCKCGESIELSDAASCSADTAMLLQCLRSGLIRNGSLAPFPSEMHVLANVGLPSLLVLFQRLFRYVRGEWLFDGHRVVDRCEERAMSTIARAFKDWDQGIEAVRSILNRRPSLGPRTSAGNGYKWYLAGNPSLKQLGDLSFIQDAIDAQAEDDRQLEEAKSAWTRQDKVWVAREQATQLTDCNPSCVIGLIDMKALTRRWICIKGKPRYFARRDEILRLVASRFEGLPLEAAAMQTGLRTDTFRRLARSQIYTVKHIPVTGGLFSVEDVNAFAGLLARHGDTKLQNENRTISQVCLTNSKSQINFAGKIVKAILAAETSHS